MSKTDNKITQTHKAIILEQLDLLPFMQGKMCVTIEFSCGTGGVINAMKVKAFTEKDFR